MGMWRSVLGFGCRSDFHLCPAFGKAGSQAVAGFEEGGVAHGFAVFERDAEAHVEDAFGIKIDEKIDSFLKKMIFITKNACWAEIF